MALGAFASKTVACILDSPQVQSAYAVGTASLGITDMKAVANGLGQGNLWLFNDIAATHWLYNHYPEHFFSGMACVHERDAQQLEKRVKEIMEDLPWASQSLPRIKHFKPSPHMVDGFETVLKIERTNAGKARSILQLEHLLAIADHEQREILQPLIYDDSVFSKWLVRERKYWRWVAPTYQLVFTHECRECNPQLKSVAPADMKVENEKSRMDWIEDAAKIFHKLMSDEEAHMLNELKIMATWVDSPDATWVY